MALFGNIRNAISVAGDSIQQPSGWLQRILALSQTSSGIAIHEANALTVGDVYKCVNVIAQTIAMLPWKVYKHLEPRGRAEARNHALYFLLHDEPNERMTSYTYRWCMVAHLLIWGRHASYIERDPTTGKILALWPLRPDRVRWEIRDGKMWFFATTIDGKTETFWDDEILYITGGTSDGYNAYSPVALHREALGLSKALEVFGASFFGNGSNNGGFLEHPGSLSGEASKRLKESFEEKHRGLENAHRITILEEGMKFTPRTIAPEQAQFILTREFQRGDLAGLWRLPPHKIGDLSRSTNNNIEHQDIEFLRDCIAPWLECIEQGGNRRLLLPREKGRLFIEFDVNGMMRGDTAARTAHCKDMFMIGAYSDNDVRDYMGLNPIDGGDRYFVPLNMVPLDSFDDAINEDELGQDEQPVLRLGRGGPQVLKAVNRIRQVHERFFRDATGRILQRKAASRKGYAESALISPVLSLIEALFGQISPENQQFAASHAAHLAAESEQWSDEKADAVALDLLDTSIRTILKRSAN
jgi:HK97 family phage portal protein